MSELTITSVDALGHATPREAVTITLTDVDGVAVEQASAGGSAVIRKAAFALDDDGIGSVNLTPNAEITPANTVWTVTLGDTVWRITKGSGTENLVDIAAAPAELGTVLGIAGLADVDVAGLADGEVLVWDETNGQWVPGAGGGGGDVASVNSQTGTVVLDATDVGADPAGTAAGLVAALDAAALPSDPTGEVTSSNVQDAIAELDARTSVLGPVDDLRVIRKPLIDDFDAPNTAASGIGEPAYRWTAETFTGGSVDGAGSHSLVRILTGTTGTEGAGGRIQTPFHHVVAGVDPMTLRWRVRRDSVSGSTDHVIRCGWLGTTANIGTLGLHGTWFETSVSGVTTTITANVRAILQSEAASFRETLGSSSTEWPLATWVEFQITYDGGDGWRFYRDGELLATALTRPQPALTHPTIEIRRVGTGTGSRTVTADYCAQILEVPR